MADELGTTTFLTVPHGDAALTVTTVEPRTHAGPVAYRPGARLPLTLGAPGLAIRRHCHPGSTSA
ncbi:hypothetical protein [Streptomyces coffeae]|uniref:Uncharacterized protein n=1 Tax=Streptomyces coffeae TaxID=621382 RepID=A0ABS1NPQ9_9ACTN|nr:hypothetical protein [Streptomyces coffeae]MBL1102009.1 hypothetical protein [Streptomyces coffeae]